MLGWKETFLSSDGAGDGNGNDRDASRRYLLADGRSEAESMLAKERLSGRTGCGECTVGRMSREDEGE